MTDHEVVTTVLEQRKRTPPLWLMRLLLSFLKRELIEEVIGDLEEEYGKKVAIRVLPRFFARKCDSYTDNVQLYEKMD